MPLIEALEAALFGEGSPFDAKSYTLTCYVSTLAVR